jgi:hypothetical protein
MLKFEPDRTLQIISENLLAGDTTFIRQTKTTLVAYSPHDDACELLKAYQEHFARELADMSDHKQKEPIWPL